MSTPTTDDVAETLAAYEALAIGTGATIQIDPPEFSDDGVTWRNVWAKTDTHEHPAFARATVHRDGVATPVYISWDEQLPAEDSWRALWIAKPMALFGARALRAALRRAFRDAIGDRREPDEVDHTATSAPASGAPARDFDAELADAATVGALDRVWNDARGARARTGAREVIYSTRRGELLAAAARPKPQDHKRPTSTATKRKRKGRR